MSAYNGYDHRVVQDRGHPAERGWCSIEDVEFATLEWVDWFNHRRLLSSIGNIPPAEFEEMYYAKTEGPTTEAGLN